MILRGVLKRVLHDIGIPKKTALPSTCPIYRLTFVWPHKADSRFHKSDKATMRPVESNPTATLTMELTGTPLAPAPGIRVARTISRPIGASTSSELGVGLL